MSHLQMASYSHHSTSSSDISTPRSSSPSSHRSSRTSISHKRMSISSRRMTDFDPSAGVNLAVIEEQMRAASLDQHRGYVKGNFAEVHQYRTTEYVSEAEAAAYQVLREPAWNKGMISPHPSPPTQTQRSRLSQQTQQDATSGSLPTLHAALLFLTLLVELAVPPPPPYPLPTQCPLTPSPNPPHLRYLLPATPRLAFALPFLPVPIVSDRSRTKYFNSRAPRPSP